MRFTPTNYSIKIREWFTKSVFGLWILLCCFLTTPLQAQTVTTGTYDLRFTNEVVDCNAATPTFCMTLQIRSAVAGESFFIGSHTAFFTYNVAAINNPTYTSLDFNEVDLCVGGVLPAYFPPMFFSDNVTGAANLTTILAVNDNACPEVFNDWMDIGEYCFEIIDGSESTNIVFDTGVTEFNRNDNLPAHIQGTLSPLDILLDCAANCDITLPVANCQDINVILDANEMGSIEVSDVDDGSSDNCYLTDVTISANTFTCADLGANSVIVTAIDIAGNTSSCTSTVTVSETELPNPVCQNIAVALDATGNVAIDATDIDNGSSDNCGIANFAVSTSSFTCANVGANPVVLTITDLGGNTATCNATVTVTDMTAPTALCQNLTVPLNAAGTGSITAAMIDNGSNDACGIASVVASSTTFGCANVGANTVTLTVTDNNTNVSTCTATVMVEDNVLPTALCQSATLPLNASGTATLTAAMIDNGSNDACGIAGMSVSPSNFTCANVGANTVTLTITDNNGNVNTCTETVTVEDNVVPTAICQDINLGLSEGTLTAAQIDNGSTDNCGIVAMSVTPNTFGCVDVRLNEVILTVEDAAGNTASCSATVDVNDDILPTAACQDVAVSLDATGNVTVPAASVDDGTSDNCGIANFTLTPNTFDCNSLGTNAVNLFVTDVNGNTASCPATVTVSDDTVPTVVCQDVSINLNGAGTASITAGQVDGGSSDNCGLAGISASLTTFDCASTGANTVALVVTDVNGNTATCNATVTVTDSTNPTTVCQDVTVVLDEMGNAMVAASEVDGGSNDNCDFSLALSQTMFTDADLGANVVTLTATDATGNIATCPASIQVESADIRVGVRFLLEGPYDANGLMTTMLATDDLLPLAHPYGGVPWNYAGTEAVATLNDIPANVTDWILIELRDGVDMENVVGVRAGFLRNDGIVLDMDGSEGLVFPVPPGMYSIIARNRNHLDVISAMPVALSNPMPYDFTTGPAQVAGTNQLNDLGDGNWALNGGDINGDGVISVADFNVYTSQASMLNVYIEADLNMDKTASVADFNIYQPNSSLIGVVQVRY